MTEPMSSDQIRGWIQCLRKCKNNGGSCSSCAATEMRLIAEFDKLTAEVSRLRAERPKSYTPRDEVSEGWHTARQIRGSSSDGRDAVRVMQDITGKITVHVTNCDIPFPIEWFTDFLLIPDYLISGLESEVRE